MLSIRHDREIWREKGDWFDARWHFSFDHYLDPANTGFGAMRVFNDDRLVPGAIWPLHPHRDVEGITYVVEGTFRHQDNVGGPPGPIPAGSVQRMTLGAGAWHSEQNDSEIEPMRFIQIWILPDRPNLKPEVEQLVLTAADRTNRLLRVVAPEGSVEGDGAARHSVSVHQDASVYVGRLEPGTTVEHAVREERGLYLYLINGAVRLDGRQLTTGDAARVESESAVRMSADELSELVAVDVPLRFEPVGVWAGRLG
jgi:redox-sensitive bicupin YhaK (pirin superfamily)